MLLNSGSDFVKVNISNSRNDSVAFEVKISKALTIQQLKSKLEVITGGNASSMQIELYTGEKLVMPLRDDSQLVGSLPIETGMRLHVTDNFNLIDYDVEKFDLTNEQYEQKHGTVRSFLKQNRLGKYNEQEMSELNEKRKQQKEKEEEHLKNINIGQRCQVTVVGNPIRRGTVMYKGPVSNKPNILIGVKYDEPLGKNDGSIDGERYFECQPKYGGFVAPLCVEVGDFPPEANEFDDEI